MLKIVYNYFVSKFQEQLTIGILLVPSPLRHLLPSRLAKSRLQLRNLLVTDANKEIKS